MTFWSLSQFIILGIFVLAAFRMGAQPLAMPSKVQVSDSKLFQIQIPVEVMWLSMLCPTHPRLG